MGTEIWQVLGEQRIGFFARRDIDKDEELSFDYNFENFGLKRQKCLCGSKNCRGWLDRTIKKQRETTEAWAYRAPAFEKNEEDRCLKNGFKLMQTLMQRDSGSQLKDEIIDLWGVKFC